MHYNESAENYLETILMLSKQLPVVRAVAEKVFERHEILTKILTSIGVPEDIASEDACKIEHVISPESFEAIKNSMAKHNKEYLK